MTLITRNQPNVLQGALMVEKKSTRKITLAIPCFRFEPLIEFGYKEELSPAISVTVNGSYAGVVYFSPVINSWYCLEETPQLYMDGKKEIVRAGESADFEATVRYLLKATWL